MQRVDQRAEAGTRVSEEQVHLWSCKFDKGLGVAESCKCCLKLSSSVGAIVDGFRAGVTDGDR